MPLLTLTPPPPPATQMIVVERGDLVFVFNFHPVNSYTDYRVGCLNPGTYKVALSSDEDVFGGWKNVTKDSDVTFQAQDINHDSRPHSFQVCVRPGQRAPGLPPFRGMLCMGGSCAGKASLLLLPSSAYLRLPMAQMQTPQLCLLTATPARPPLHAGCSLPLRLCTCSLPPLPPAGVRAQPHRGGVRPRGVVRQGRGDQALGRAGPGGQGAGPLLRCVSSGGSSRRRSSEGRSSRRRRAACAGVPDAWQQQREASLQAGASVAGHSKLRLRSSFGDVEGSGSPGVGMQLALLPAAWSGNG